jgi:hemolysin activation/secretion protein
MRAQYFKILALSVLALSSGQAFAVETVRGTTDAGRVEKRLELNNVPSRPVSDSIDVKPIAPTEAPAGADQMFLTLVDVSVEGMTVYNNTDIQVMFAAKAGQKIALSDVYVMAAQLTAKYRNDGYILTQVIVPPQTIEGGHVKLQAVEGRIDAISLEGPLSAYEAKIVNGYAQFAKKAGVTNIKNLEHAMLLINDLPGVSARSVLSPSPTQVGAADMRVIIERKKYDGEVGFDSYGSPYLGPNQLSAAYATNSLLGLSERIAVQAAYAPGKQFTKELAYGEISYAQPVGVYGTFVKATLSKAFTEPGDDLKSFNINGRSTYGEVRVDQPVFKTRAFSLNLNAQLDARKSNTTSNVDVRRVDNIRALRIGADANFSDTLLGAAVNTANITVSQGLGIFGASDKGQTGLSRASGDPQFLKYEAELQRLQRVTTGLNVLTGVRGQYSSDALLSPEEFGVGGSGYGRGYDPSEIVGDKGVAAKAELQWSNPVKSSVFNTYQVFAFYDVGRIWNKDATTSADKINSIASTGFGARGNFLFGTTAEAFWALPLTADVASDADKKPRVAFKINRAF